MGSCWLSGIILEKMGKHLWAGEIIDGDDFVAWGTPHLAESKTANASEPVNSNLY